MAVLLNYDSGYLLHNNDIITFTRESPNFENPFKNMPDDMILFDSTNESISCWLSASWLNVIKINNISYNNSKMDIKSFIKKYELDKVYEETITISEDMFIIHLCNHCMRNSLVHMIYNLFGQIYNYKINHSEKKLCMVETMHTAVVKSLLNIMDIPSEKIFILKPKILYNFNRLFAYSVRSNSWYDASFNFLINKLTDSISIQPTNEKIGYIIFKSTNKQYSDRGILNNIELETYLKDKNIDILDMATYTLEEKPFILSKYTTLITMYGSTLGNVFFAKNLKKLIIFNSNISHTVFGNEVIDWLRKYNKTGNSIKIIYQTFPSDNEKSIKSNLKLDMNWLDNAMH
jgi:hypothetical protein